MKTYLLIYNPVSGKRNFRNEHLGRIVNALAQSGADVVVHQTQCRNDAREYCLHISENEYDQIVCCGGDGTLHEVVNGMLQSGLRIPLGYIPHGSTNDYAKNMGISSRNAVRCIQEGKICQLDVGNFNGEFFNYVAAFGAFTDVSFSTPQKTKNSLGYLAYLLEGIKRLPSLKSYHMRCRIDDRYLEDDFLIGMITNALSVAGIKNRNTGLTKLNDGLLEYIFIKTPQTVVDFQTIILRLLNSNMDSQFIYYGQAGSFAIESDPMELTLDGEASGEIDQVNINVYANAINMILNKKSIIFFDDWRED